MTELGLLSILCLAALAAAAGLLAWVRARPSGAPERVRAARALETATFQVLGAAHRRAAVLACGLAVAAGAARAATGPRAAVPFAVLATLVGAAVVLVSAHVGARACLTAAARIRAGAGAGEELPLAIRAATASALGAEALAALGALMVVGLPWVTTSGAPPLGLVAHLPELGLGACGGAIVVHQLAGAFSAGAIAGSQRGQALLGATDSRDPALITFGSAHALELAARSAEHSLSAIAVTVGLVWWGVNAGGAATVPGPLVTLPLLARGFGVVVAASAAFAVAARAGEGLHGPLGRARLVGAIVAFAGGAATSVWLLREAAGTLTIATALGAAAPLGLSGALAGLARSHGALAREVAESAQGEEDPTLAGASGATLVVAGALLAISGAVALVAALLGGAPAPTLPLVLALSVGLATAPLSLSASAALRTLGAARELDRAARRGESAAAAIPGESAAAGAARAHLALGSGCAALLLGASVTRGVEAPPGAAAAGAVLGVALLLAVVGVALRAALRAARVTRGEVTRQVESAPGPREEFVPSYRACLDTLAATSRARLWVIVALTLGAPLVLAAGLAATQDGSPRARWVLASFAMAAATCALVQGTAGAASGALVAARASLAPVPARSPSAPAAPPFSLVAALGVALVSLHLSTFL